MRFLRVIDILYLILGIVSLLLWREAMEYLVLFGGIYFFLSGLYKAYSLGIDTLRGRFWIFFSGFGLLGPGIYLDFHPLGVAGRVFLLIAVALMFAGILRQGFRLRGRKLLLFLLIAVPAVVITFLALGGRGPYYLFLWGMDILIFLIILHNFFAFIGGDLGRRWLMGLVAVSFYLLGELFYFADMEVYYLTAYMFTFFLVNIIAHIED